MIYTVTLNPALDYVIQVEHFKAGCINRNKEEHIYYGGKGINVSTILNELGYKSCALGFIAGFTGQALNNGLKESGILTDFVEVEKGMTRINVKMKSDEETEINGMGPMIEKEDFNQLKNQISKLEKEDMLILSGSIPKCMDANAYEQILDCVQDGVKIVVDAEKDLLMKSLKYKPFLIKPNHVELADMFQVELKNDEDIVQYATQLQKLGARNVLISMAKNGSILVAEDGTVEKMGVCMGTVVNSVGAGDSMVAGFVAGYLDTHDYTFALTLGTACGGATAFHSGLATKDEIDVCLKEIVNE